MSGAPFVLLESADVSSLLVGSKARTLAKLKSAGFKVPPGAVLTADAPDDSVVMEPILGALGSGPFAVRSSGVSEDGVDESLAGRYQSLLDVEPSALVDAVTRVREYARLEDGMRIPVLVQPMVHPLCAGVAFTADPVTGDRSTTLITATAGLADRLLSGQLAGDEWRVRDGKAKPVRRPEGVVGRRLAHRVAGVADRVASEIGSPQDVEWVWDGNEVWVVQARPITGLPAQVSWEPPAPGVYHRSFRFGEWIPEPVTPLFESWLLTRMEQRLHEWINEQIGQIAPEPLHVVINGWYYYSMNWMPAPGVALGRNLRRILPRLRKNWRKVAGMFPQTIRFGYRQFEKEWRQEVLPSYRRAVRHAGERVETMPVDKLVGLVDELSDRAGLYFASMAVVAGSAYKLENRLAVFWNRHLKREIDRSHMVLLQGLEPSAEARQAPLLESLDWWKAPMPPTNPPSSFEALRARRLETETWAEQVLGKSPRKLARFRRLLADAQYMEPVREEQVGQLSLAWPVMRRALQRLGERLQETGSVGSAEDVFFLTRSEVLSLLDDPAPMFEPVKARRKRQAEASRLVAPLMVGDVPMIVRMMIHSTGRALGATRSDDALVHGVPASPGRATGPVRIVRHLSEFESFEEGEVLVAPLTAPAWTVLFSRAAAVVADVGNALAHASIVAREYGIPAVVGCGDATSRLRDGQMVTVDGSTGNVEPAQQPATESQTRIRPM